MMPRDFDRPSASFGSSLLSSSARAADVPRHAAKATAPAKIKRNIFFKMNSSLATRETTATHPVPHQVGRHTELHRKDGLVVTSILAMGNKRNDIASPKKQGRDQ